ncbi:MAG: glycosyltransferase [candidate division Zixibacteria bacterium]|nr:glycosyltransferase [candidate division Zixibacteria bacterium]
MTKQENSLQLYSDITGPDVVEHLRQLAEPLKGMKVLHVNSTRIGGGVAEILNKMVPLMQDLGLETSWEIIEGNSDFYQCTKGFHNAIQGNRVNIPEHLLRTHTETNKVCYEGLSDKLNNADVVIVHDPQPAGLINYAQNRKNKWVWRCHIDASKPYRPVWNYLKGMVANYDASIFSLASFAQSLPHPIYLIPPSIDPLHEKNVELSNDEIKSLCRRFDFDFERPLIVQISRFDRFKDPVGVIEAYQLTKKFIPDIQLVLAGGEADDDPEGKMVLEEVRTAAADDPDIHILLLPGAAHRIINALQRAADIVIQKSVKEGFGLTVTEAMWKRKPVIGGDTGGIRIQVINHHTGFLVNTPEGAALRIRYLFHQQDKLREMGIKARNLVRENFLITRHLREYLTLIYALLHKKEDRIEIGI